MAASEAGGGGGSPSDADERLDAALRDHMGFSSFSLTMARAWLSKMGEGEDGVDDKLPALRAWLLQLLNGRKRPSGVNRWQRQCPEVLPGLRAMPVWDPGASPRLAWVRGLEASWEAIRDEALALRQGSVAAEFQPYRAPSWAGGAAAAGGGAGASGEADRPDSVARAGEAAGGDGGTGAGRSDGGGAGAEPGGGGHTEAHAGGAWNVCYLDLHGAVDTSGAAARCPVTAAALSRVPRAYGHAMFSALAPGTEVASHTGPTSKKLRLHLPLSVPPPGPDGEPSCCLRVADRVVPQREGRALVFDDSFEHQAWNRHASAPRLVLILDVWHPDLTDAEVKFLRFAQKAQTRRAKAVSATTGGSVEGADDFLSVLATAKKDAVDASDVFAGAP